MAMSSTFASRRVAKQLDEATVRMLAYNGSVPGPTLRVPQGSELVVNAVNEGDLETTVHWHGLRLENRYDGTAETQTPMPVCGSFAYRLRFPDPGVYWYHPHIREDYGQEMGSVWEHRRRPLGARLLAAGQPRARADDRRHPARGGTGRAVQSRRIDVHGHGPVRQRLPRQRRAGAGADGTQGEVVRFYLTDTANSRVFNVGIPGARMKRVGGDSGHYEREEFAEGVIVAPSERSSSMFCLTRRGSSRSSTERPTGPTRWRPSPSRTSRRSRHWRRSSRTCGRIRTWR
jgi:hypothetical protein